MESNKNEKNPIERMQQMYHLVKDLILGFQPDYIILEAVQYQSNQRTYAQLSQLQGVLFSLMFDMNIGFNTVSATEWRKYCGVRGRKRVEQKASAIQIVKDRYGIDVSEDMAEAILIGEWAVGKIKQEP